MFLKIGGERLGRTSLLGGDKVQGVNLQITAVGEAGVVGMKFFEFLKISDTFGERDAVPVLQCVLECLEFLLHEGSIVAVGIFFKKRLIVFRVFVAFQRFEEFLFSFVL